MKDKELIEALRLGNTSVLKHCYQNLPLVCKYVLNNSGSDEDAHDVFQEAVMVFYHNAIKDGFELTSSISTYIVAIGKNVWRNKLRKAKRDGVALEHFKEEEGLRTNESPELSSKSERIIQLFKSIKEPCNTILKKYYYQNISLKVIAETMGYKSERVARQQKYKCMKKIKDQIIGSLKIEEYKS